MPRGLTPETKVLFHRNIVERAQLAIPFVRFDSDPYLVITDDGRLLEHLDRPAGRGERVAGGQPGRASPEDYGGTCVRCHGIDPLSGYRTLRSHTVGRRSREGVNCRFKRGCE